MSYVLEWRNKRLGHSGRCVVNYVRVFRSVGALKAFIVSPRFKKNSANELRVSRRDPKIHQAVVTTEASILRWDPADQRLPRGLISSRWETDLAEVGAAEQIWARIASELEQAHGARLLTDEQFNKIRCVVARSLGITAA